MLQDKLKIGARRNGVMLALVSVILLGPVVCGAQAATPQKQETVALTPEQHSAQKLLTKAHPDWMALTKTPEYNQWLESRTADFRQTFESTWDPNVVSKGLTEFKSWRETGRQKAALLKKAKADQKPLSFDEFMAEQERAKAGGAGKDNPTDWSKFVPDKISAPGTRGDGGPEIEDKKPKPNVFDQFDKPSNARTPIGLFDDLLDKPKEAEPPSSILGATNSHTVAWVFGAAVFIAIALLAWLRFKKTETATGVGAAAQSPIYERNENSYAEREPHNLQLSTTKGNAMSQNQKHILMAVLAIVAAMLVYPPFQVIANNGTVFNMGYGWIFDSPKRGGVIANVNVPMLLIQWVGVLIVGGITFFLVKSSPQEPLVSGSNAKSENSSLPQPDPMLGTKLEKLQSAKKLLFIALAIDIAVTVIVIGSSIWAIGVLKDIDSGVRTGDPSLASSIDFWASFSMIVILTAIGVGLGLVKWLNSCYQFSKEALHATGFKQEWWLGIGWILPFFNLFKPYQVINEIYRTGSPTYSRGDDWKKESGSGLMLTWWIFWVVVHLIWASLIKMIVQSSDPALTIPQIIGAYEASAWLGATSIIIAGLWFVVANHLTQRLVDRSSRYAPLPQPSFPDSTKVAPISSGQHAVQNATSVVQNALVATPVSSSPSNPYTGQPDQTGTEPTQQATPTSWKAADESDEDRIYAAIAKELEDGVQDKGLWTRLFAESDGDEKQTKVLYIKQRAERLMVAERMRRAQVEREQEAILLQERIKAQATNQLIQDTSTRYRKKW